MFCSENSVPGKYKHQLLIYTTSSFLIIEIHQEIKFSSTLLFEMVKRKMSVILVGFRFLNSAPIYLKTDPQNV